MATYYVSSVDGDNADNGTTWALAVATLKYAVETLAASGGPHTILVDSEHSESLTADTTITAAQDLQIISVDRTGSDAPLAGALIGAQTANYSITIAGAFKLFFYGLTFQTGTNLTATRNIALNNTNGGHVEYESSHFVFNQTGGTNPRVVPGSTGQGANTYTRLTHCSFKFSSTASGINANGNADLVGCSIDPESSSLTALFYHGANGTNIRCEGCDFSELTGTLVGNFLGNGTAFLEFRQCKLGAGVTPLATPTVVLNRGQTTVTMYDCHAGDTHCAFFHGDPFGTTIEETNIYATAGAQSGGSNVSYKIVTRPELCSYYTPYVGPWIAKYHTGTSAVTPSFEVLRDGSATAYQDDEVWGEWQYKGTAGEVTLTTVSDRMALLGTPANQATGDLDASGWTGENATAWFGKLHTASTITPAEVGHIYGRVVVGEPDITVYYDPTIRLA